MPVAVPPSVVVVALAMLLGIQPVTTDLYLPALPQISTELQAPVAAAQLTLSALIASFGLAQLVWGPVADRFGRRPVLLAGLGLYVVASLASALAPSIGWLVAARTLQGIGLASSVVCARAMVRDLFAPAEGTHVMTRALSGLGIIALASPVVGGALAAWLGWRAALLALAVFGAASWALVFRRIPESAPQLNPHATRPGPLVAAYARITAHPTFRAWTLLMTATYAGLFAFLAGSSFVYINRFGASRVLCGLLIASSAVAYLVGTVWCRRWLVAHGIRGAVRRGGVATLASAVLYTGFALADAHTITTLAVAQLFFTFGHGVHQPCGQAGVVGPFPGSAGAAAALSGFVLALGAFAMGGWLGFALPHGVGAYALTIAGLAVVTATIAWTLVQRHGEPVPARAAAARP